MSGFMLLSSVRRAAAFGPGRSLRLHKSTLHGQRRRSLGLVLNDATRRPRASTQYFSSVSPAILEDISNQTHSLDTTISIAVDKDSDSSQITKKYVDAFGNDLLLGLESRPRPNGNWDPYNPLDWTKDFGKRSKEYEEKLVSLAKLRPGDEGYFDVSDIAVPGVTMVRTRERAKHVVQTLMNADPSIFHACDTEVMDISLKEEGPVGNGYVTCVSIYSGPDFDYGLGDGPGSTLWIDNLDDAHGVLQEFKQWFQDPRFLKVWHNYGFDRHVMWNEGINCLGFGGDTMHMARLEDTSRMKQTGSGSGYSLEALSDDLAHRRKQPMKEIFGVKRLRKDGSEGTLVDVPAIEVLQRDPEFRARFISYSCYDAESTWVVRQKLQQRLEKKPWLAGKSLYDYYVMHMRPFGEVLTDMERRGIRVNARDYLAGVEKQARQDRDNHLNAFRKWASSLIGPDGLALNPASSVQLCTFLFGGAENVKTREKTEKIRVFKVPREEIPDDAMEAYKARDATNADASSQANNSESALLEEMTGVQLRDLCRELGLKLSGKKDDLINRLKGHFLTMPERGESKPSLSPEEILKKMKVAELKGRCKELGLKLSGKKAELIERLIPHTEPEETDAPKDDIAAMWEEDLRHALAARGLDLEGTASVLRKRLRDDIAYALEIMAAVSPATSEGYKTVAEALEQVAKDNSKISEILAHVESKSTAESKFVDVTITSLEMVPEKFTQGGAPSVTADVLRNLAGNPFDDPPKYGSAYNVFGGGDKGREACIALFSLCAIGSIDTMISNFLTSLQSLADSQSRVHCSLNLNTETGRLSSRRPNLQNQPALEKDKYKIRKAFESSPGNRLIVADYGQLELRLLASMTNCKSMVDAFKSGGDFHSRTALDMFDYVQKAVDNGDVLLEWDYASGDPPKPLLKDKFASERRKAKTLNFSIAYGKTAHGLSQDWGVSREEADSMLQAWYKARPEVERWQAATKQYARKNEETRTLMGRYRQLPGAGGRDRKLVGHLERASINTPVQGGAADIAMMAMIKINNNALLKRLGWILLMQIHDEVILEGPEETAEEAFVEVVKCMEEPWVFGLAPTRVPLLVDGSCKYDNWYDAK